MLVLVRLFLRSVQVFDEPESKKLNQVHKILRLGHYCSLVGMPKSSPIQNNFLSLLSSSAPEVIDNTIIVNNHVDLD